VKQYKNSIWHLNLDQQIKATAQQILAAEKDLEPHYPATQDGLNYSCRLKCFGDLLEFIGAS
jgi:hypothetical protein